MQNHTSEAHHTVFKQKKNQARAGLTQQCQIQQKRRASLTMRMNCERIALSSHSRPQPSCKAFVLDDLPVMVGRKLTIIIALQRRRDIPGACRWMPVHFLSAILRCLTQLVVYRTSLSTSAVRSRKKDGKCFSFKWETNETQT